MAAHDNMAGDYALSGRAVLLVEDEGIIAMLGEDIFSDAGCTVTLAMQLDEAVEQARSQSFDLAVLDVNLGSGQTSYPVAEILLQRAIPFLFVTGYDATGLDDRFRNITTVRKPYASGELVRAAAALVGGPAAT